MNAIYKSFDPDNAIGRVDRPTVKRYLNALDRLRKADPAYYHEVIEQMTDPQGVVAEAVLPVATLPLNELTPGERTWRLLADDTHSGAGL